MLVKVEFPSQQDTSHTSHTRLADQQRYDTFPMQAAPEPEPGTDCECKYGYLALIMTCDNT